MSSLDKTRYEQGIADCKLGIPAIGNDEWYFAGYSYQYELEAKESYEYL